MRKVAFTTAALRNLNGLPEALRILVIAAIADFAAGREVGAKAMQNRRGEVRLKVGDHRVIVTVERASVTVVRIGHRATVYRP